MAIANKRIGTYMGVEIEPWDGISKPNDGDMWMDHSTLEYKVYYNGEFHAVDIHTPDAMEWIADRLRKRDQLTDEFLEEKYEDLKALKEQYNELRDKYKTFEILGRDYE